MKHHISIKKRLLPMSAVAIAGAFLLGSCTKNFEAYNTDTANISNEDLSQDRRLVGEPLKQVQQSIYFVTPAWNTQLQQNLIGDLYSGYMASPTPFAGNVNNQTYALVNGWNTFPWDDAYNNVMSPSLQVFRNAAKDYPDFYAWAKILRIEAMHRVSDIYGPIIFTHYGQINSDGSITYDSQKDAYYAFFKDLDSAIDVLTPIAQHPPATPAFTNFDLAYGGDYTKWVKFANTLRLRLAIRISMIDATMSKKEGEKSLANAIGLMTVNGDNFNVTTGTNQHPLDVITGWGDIKAGAPLGSFLTGYNDPRAAKYLVPATDPAVAGKFQGIRGGINIDAKARYSGYASLIAFPNQIQLMTAAEAWFLKAEAALRGWAGAGDAQTNYNNGIKASFTQYGLDATSYINDATSTAAQYIDPNAVSAGQNDVKTGNANLSTITIKWNSADGFDKSLERIITQKWLAVFPDGQEAWSEFRRTGYPKLFPVVVNNSNGTIPTAKFIRRINFAQSEVSTNIGGVQNATKLLGGPDTGGTPLWWDTRN
ncbi:RagB/SusD family nutrient uptake outer membrane protein [Pinibacter soli]|uniref:RagB/SusD family nutrient uptake outer membrane protein n=1 Tax=Pinibacter soli TaxID=3044211 RepID=A0ABT6RAX6_9BACT|nr:RagB/SusD family nutrient uptake outer membrane protein [Pinibacter soli]MDI3319734.1 RagB/SusD family nutrient uptake outer membrane protein [Pinibacter soli]